MQRPSDVRKNPRRSVDEIVRLCGNRIELTTKPELENSCICKNDPVKDKVMRRRDALLGVEGEDGLLG